jgi:hypothetical protein
VGRLPCHTTDTSRSPAAAWLLLLLLLLLLGMGLLSGQLQGTCTALECEGEADDARLYDPRGTDHVVQVVLGMGLLSGQLQATAMKCKVKSHVE